MSSRRLNETELHELAVIDAIVRGGGGARPEDAALTDFTLLVRNARPIPNHGEAAALDARVEQSSSSRKRSDRLIFKPAFAGFCALLLVVGVVGTGYMRSDLAEGPSSTIDSIIAEEAHRSENALGVAEPTEDDMMKAAMPESSQSASSVAASPGTSMQGPLPSAARGAARSVAWTAELLLAANGNKIDELSQQVNEITDELGGYVAESNVRSFDDNKGVAGFTLMIPSQERLEAMNQLSKLAHVRSRQQSSEDITVAANTSERNLKRATARVNRLEAQLDEAAGQQQRAVLRRELSQAENQVRILKRQVRVDRGRVNYVPIELTIAADSSADDAGKGTIGKAVSTAGKILTGALAGVIIVAAALVPLALLVMLIWLGWRRWSRGRSDRALDAAAKPQPE